MVASFTERRKHLRLDNNVPIKLSSNEADVVTETRNLSCAGAYCKVDKYFEPMTKIKIHLLLPLKRRSKTVTKKLTCDGIVVRSESVPGENYYNVAIFFNQIGPADSKVISDYVHQQVEDKQRKAQEAPRD